MSTSPDSSSTEPGHIEVSSTESRLTDPVVEETSRTQALDAQTPPTSTLVVESRDEVEPATAPHLAATSGATRVEPVPASPGPSPEPSPDPFRETGWAARGVRMRTVVLGLVLLAVSITSLLRVLTDVRIDDSLVVLILLVVAGVLLLGGGIASAVRESRGARPRG